MNIITRKKEIMKAIEKLNETTKLANDAIEGLDFENYMYFYYLWY